MCVCARAILINEKLINKQYRLFLNVTDYNFPDTHRCSRSAKSENDKIGCLFLD